MTGGAADPVPPWPGRHDPAALSALLRERAADPACEWSTGTFGALAEFSRAADEPFTLRDDAERLELSTARGALRLNLHPSMRALAYETLGEHGGWQHGLALCLPREAARVEARRTITELGPDGDAIAAADRNAIRVDLGLGCETAELCVRSDAPEVLAALRAYAGRALLGEGRALLAHLAAWSPHRVFATRLARIEVRQPIPPPDGVTPVGPHTHLLPQLMREGRTHAATLPIPPGWVPCATLHPPPALRRGPGGAAVLDAAAHDGVQALLAQWGEPGLQAIKRATREALDAGRSPSWRVAALGRHERIAARVAVRQWRAAGMVGHLPAWAAALEPSG